MSLVAGQLLGRLQEILDSLTTLKGNLSGAADVNTLRTCLDSMISEQYKLCCIVMRELIDSKPISLAAVAPAVNEFIADRVKCPACNQTRFKSGPALRSHLVARHGWTEDAATTAVPYDDIGAHNRKQHMAAMSAERTRIGEVHQVTLLPQPGITSSSSRLGHNGSILHQVIYSQDVRSLVDVSAQRGFKTEAFPRQPLMTSDGTYEYDSSRREMQQNENESLPTHSYQCTECSTSFQSTQLLCEHMMSGHNWSQDMIAAFERDAIYNIEEIPQVGAHTSTSHQPPRPRVANNLVYQSHTGRAAEITRSVFSTGAESMATNGSVAANLPSHLLPPQPKIPRVLLSQPKNSSFFQIPSQFSTPSSSSSSSSLAFTPTSCFQLGTNIAPASASATASASASASAANATASTAGGPTASGTMNALAMEAQRAAAAAASMPPLPSLSSSTSVSKSISTTPSAAAIGAAPLTIISSQEPAAIGYSCPECITKKRKFGSLMALHQHMQGKHEWTVERCAYVLESNSVGERAARGISSCSNSDGVKEESGNGDGVDAITVVTDAGSHADVNIGGILRERLGDGDGDDDNRHDNDDNMRSDGGHGGSKDYADVASGAGDKKRGRHHTDSAQAATVSVKASGIPAIMAGVSLRNFSNKITTGTTTLNGSEVRGLGGGGNGESKTNKGNRNGDDGNSNKGKRAVKFNLDIIKNEPAYSAADDNVNSATTTMSSSGTSGSSISIGSGNLEQPRPDGWRRRGDVEQLQGPAALEEGEEGEGEQRLGDSNNSDDNNHHYGNHHYSSNGTDANNDCADFKIDTSYGNVGNSNSSNNSNGNGCVSGSGSSGNEEDFLQDNYSW